MTPSAQADGEPIGTRRYQHPKLGFELDLPRGAKVAAELPLVVHLGPESRADFQPALVITAERLPEGASLGEWADASLARELETLAAPLVIDRERFPLAHGEMIRTLVHHITARHAVTLEQWWTTARGRAYVLSASCATSDYDQLADDIIEVAHSFSPGERSAP